MRPNLSAIVGAVFLLGAAESVHPQAVPAAAAIAALRTHVGTSPQRPLVLVPDSSGDTVLAQAVAKAIGAKSRSAADGRSCRGFVPQCGWRPPGGDTIVIRIQVRSANPDRVLFVVDTWGLLTNPTPQQSSFYERLMVEVVYEGKWVTRRWWMDFAT